MMQISTPRRLIDSCIIHVSINPRTLPNCHLEVGNGNEYPEILYTPTTDMTCVYTNGLKYDHKNNKYGEGTLRNRANFSTIFPVLYFDLTNKKWILRMAPRN